MVGQQKSWDVFISHSSEDKNAVARPLAEMLQRVGIRVWYDEFTLGVGDSLSKSIDYGLANSKFAVLVLSRSFFLKQWPQRELAGLVARTIVSSERLILPVWHKITREELLSFSPPLADVFALSTERGIINVAYEIAKVVQSHHFKFKSVPKDSLRIGVFGFYYPDHMNDKTHFMKTVESKSKKVARTLYGKILNLGYSPDFYPSCSTEEVTLVKYKAIPSSNLLELMHSIDLTLVRLIGKVEWRRNKHIGWNLLIQLGKDTGSVRTKT